MSYQTNLYCYEIYQHLQDLHNYYEGKKWKSNNIIHLQWNSFISLQWSSCILQIMIYVIIRPARQAIYMIVASLHSLQINCQKHLEILQVILLNQCTAADRRHPHDIQNNMVPWAHTGCPKKNWDFVQFLVFILGRGILRGKKK